MDVFYTEMVTITCPICLDPARVPVRFTCFPCVRDMSRPSCNSITRVCLMCAREYLQLNQPRHERDATRKCLICNATCSPSMLNATSAYEKDYLIMSLDTIQRFSCSKCPFEGTHHELDHHYCTTCPERYEHCRTCRRSFQASDQGHKMRCPEYIECSECREYIHIGIMYDHYLVDHQMEYCAYCTDWYKVETNHPVHCPKRFVECLECHKFVRYCNRQNHIRNHFIQYQERCKEILIEQKELEDKLSKLVDSHISSLFKENKTTFSENIQQPWHDNT